MELFEQLITEHNRLEAASASDPDGVDLEQIGAFIERVRAAGTAVSDERRREDLRAILQAWATAVFEHTGRYPPMELAGSDGPPPIQTVLRPGSAPAGGSKGLRSSLSAAPGPPSLPPWLIGVGIGLLAVIAAAIIWFVYLQPASRAAGAAVPTPAGTLAAPEAAAAPTEAGTAPAATAIIEPVEAATAPAVSAPTATAPAVRHTVGAGDTLTNIARRYSTTVSAILAANGLVSDVILVGQVLAIPAPAGAAPSVPAGGAPAGGAPAAVAPASSNLPELVIRGEPASGVTALRVAPAADAQAIASLSRGTFAHAAGRTADATWFLIELADGFTRGWVPAGEVGLLFPADPTAVPVVMLP